MVGRVEGQQRARDTEWQFIQSFPLNEKVGCVYPASV